MPGNFRLPKFYEDRTVVIGATGSGKSTFAAWLFSHASYARRPWIIVDYKGEKIFRRPELKHVIREIQPTSAIPTKPGIFIVRPLPTEQEEMDAFFWRVWAKPERRGGTGLLCDEGYLLPDFGGYHALLTQGRSKRIPMIILSQRPVEMNRFTFSEASYFAVFDLIDERDQKTVEAFTPLRLRNREPLPRYHCLWYDVHERTTSLLSPAPDVDSIALRIAHNAPRSWWS